MKKGQSSYYVIVGILAIIMISVFMFLNQGTKDLEGKTSVDFSAAKRNSEQFIDSCIEKITLQAIDRFGLIDSESMIEAYVEEHLVTCSALVDDRAGEVV